MKFEKEDIINHICKIREDIGHENVKIAVKDILFDESSRVMRIITPDRPEKSAVIGKGGWVVGRLKEELNINSIHVEAYTDILLKEYKLKLTLKKLEDILKTIKLTDPLPLENLCYLLSQSLENINDFDAVLQDWDSTKESKNSRAIVALSGGVDSSFSLIIAKLMGFNPIAVTVNPGNIILPKYFQKNVEALSDKLNVKHVYINVEMQGIINDSLEGRFHPCGRCSKVIKEAVLDYAKENKIEFLIYGDLLSTGNQSIVAGGDIIKINLPAMLSVTKGEIKNVASKYDIFKKGGYGCPLIDEVHKKYPHMRKFSMQRVLRETRAGILEPGEALEMIMKII